jgi:protein TonB
MQSPAEFSRNHQPAYVPTTNRMLAGVLTMGVYALVLVVASHRSPVPSRAPPPEIAARMEPDVPRAEQDPQTPQSPPQTTPQEAPRNASQNPFQDSPRQQGASRQPSFLERLFSTQTAAPVPSMAPAPRPEGQSGAKPSRGEELASAAPAAQSAQGSFSHSDTPGQQPSKAKDNSPSPCPDAAWVRAVTNRVQRFRPARQSQASGVAMMRLVIRRSGWLNELEIAKTSGNTALDAAAYAMLHKAQPLPRIPDRIAADRIALQLPIAFGVGTDLKITVSCGA